LQRQDYSFPHIRLFGVLVILIFWENGTSMRLRNRFLQVSLPFLGRFRSIRLLHLVWEFLLCGSWGTARMKAKNLDSESLNLWETIQSISLLYVVICKWEKGNLDVTSTSS